MKGPLDSRATSRESSAVAGGLEVECCISPARVVASGSLEPTGGTSVSNDPDASTGMSLWDSRLWHEVYTCHLATKHQAQVKAHGVRKRHSTDYHGVKLSLYSTIYFVIGLYMN